MQLSKTFETSTGIIEEFVDDYKLDFDKFAKLKGSIKLIWKARNSSEIVYGLGDISSHLNTNDHSFEAFFYKKFSSNNPSPEWQKFDAEVRVIPEYLFRDGKVFWRKITGSEFRLEQFDSKENDVKQDTSIETPNIDEWTNLISEIKKSEVEKVVLSRKVQKNISLENFMQRAKGLIKDENYFFLIMLDNDTVFVSCSPERLLKIKDNVLTTEAIAGTRPIGQSEEENIGFEQELLSSAKDRHEHDLVKKHILAVLETSNTQDVSMHEDVLKLSYVQHLRTMIEARVTKSFDWQNAIEQMHPTPAICGYPKNLAYQFILANESFDRGLFAGLFGHVTRGSEEVEFAVGIRSALFHDGQMYVYAGAGIVDQSDAADEWLETRNKMRNFL